MYNKCSICGGTLLTCDTNGICVGCRNTLACAPPKLNSVTLEDKIKQLEERIKALEDENFKIKHPYSISGLVCKFSKYEP